MDVDDDDEVLDVDFTRFIVFLLAMAVAVACTLGLV